MEAQAFQQAEMRVRSAEVAVLYLDGHFSAQGSPEDVNRCLRSLRALMPGGRWMGMLGGFRHVFRAGPGADGIV